MNSVTKRYAIPLAVLVIAGIVCRLLNTYLSGEMRTVIVTTAIALSCFSFGVSLNPYRKNRRTWVKKLIVAFVVLLLILWELGVIVFPQLTTVMNFLGISGFVRYLLYVFCGWTFFS